jgi:predicted ArsR family transcriptional regulator
MSTRCETSDAQLLELLRNRGALGVADLARANAVTATAVRQRLARLMRQGLVDREVARHGRGRPSHRYALTEKARRLNGGNFADLALVLWDEIRAVKDTEVRRGLLQRLADAMTRRYAGRIEGSTLDDRTKQLASLFAERGVPIEVSTSPAGPKLAVLDCPYTELAEKDRSICAVEKMMFASLLDSPLRLAQCRFDGHDCCEFETHGPVDIVGGSLVQIPVT